MAVAPDVAVSRAGCRRHPNVASVCFQAPTNWPSSRLVVIITAYIHNLGVNIMFQTRTVIGSFAVALLSAGLVAGADEKKSPDERSEERRVGKEWKYRWWAEH